VDSNIHNDYDPQFMTHEIVRLPLPQARDHFSSTCLFFQFIRDSSVNFFTDSPSSCRRFSPFHTRLATMVNLFAIVWPFVGEFGSLNLPVAVAESLFAYPPKNPEPSLVRFVWRFFISDFGSSSKTRISTSATENSAPAKAEFFREFSLK